MTVYTYSGSHLVGIGVWEDGMRLAAAATPAITTALVSAVLDGTDLDVTMSGPLSAEGQAALAAIVGAHASPATLDSHRLYRMGEINSKSEEILRRGFEYPPASGVVFSLSEHAQSKYESAAIAVLAGVMTYPLLFDSLDDLDSVLLNDATEFWTFYGLAMGAARAALGSGSLLKQEVRDATTHTAIAAVVDDRT